MKAPKTPEKLIAYRKARIARLEVQLATLKGKLRAEEEALEHLQDSLTPEPTTSLNPPVGIGQPFRGSQRVLLEKRTLRGRLDFTGEQPPPGDMNFDDVYYQLYFKACPTGKGSWEELRAWLDSKGWVVRAKTW